MSAKKRRRKAKIELLRKLDATYSHLYLMASPRRDGHRASCPRRDGYRASRLWWGSIVPLGDKLESQKPGVWHSLPRFPGGPDILMDNYRERRGANA